MKIHNFVVARFSIRMFTAWEQKVYGDESNRENWFSSRSAIFRDTLYKSLRLQTVKPLRVFLLMDDTDRPFWEKYLDQKDSMLQPIFAPPKLGFQEVGDRIFEESRENVAISRIDSDDIVACNYLEEVNRAMTEAIVTNRKFDYVVATRGYRSDYKSVMEIYYRCSPFVTMFKSKYNRENIYSMNHERAVEFDHISNSTARWIQVLHGNNVGNAFLTAFVEGDEFEAAVATGPKIVGAKPKPTSEFWPDHFFPIAPPS